MSEEKLDIIVGITGPVGLLLVIVLLITNFCIKYRVTKPTILILSKLSSLLNISSLVCVTLTYYTPYLGTNECFCGLLWQCGLIFFILSLFCVKYMYIARVYSYFSTKNNVPISIKLLSVTFCFSMLTSVAMSIILADGECHANIQRYGCMNAFHISTVYFGLIVIALDVILFVCFSRDWLKKINLIIVNSPKSVEIANKSLLKSFKIQLGFTLAALFFTFLDGLAHILVPKYCTLAIFAIDNVMVSLANNLSFIKTRIALCNLIKCKCMEKNIDLIIKNMVSIHKYDNKQTTSPNQSPNVSSNGSPIDIDINKSP